MICYSIFNISDQEKSILSTCGLLGGSSSSILSFLSDFRYTDSGTDKEGSW